MRNLTTKLKRALALKFEDSRMEREYRMIKTQNSRAVFISVALLSVIINIIGIINAAKGGRWNVFFVSLSTTIFTVLLAFLLPFIRKQDVQYLTILTLIAFALTRFIALFLQHSAYTQITLFYQGFVVGTIQVFILTQIQNFIVQVLTILLLSGVRYACLLVIDGDNFNAYFWTRFILMDLFILYVIYINEKSERRVFRSFIEGRDELTKFKELLAESLPQSLVVVDFLTQKKLFANHTFEFSFTIEDTRSSNVTELMMSEENTPKLNLRLLQMDLATLREVGSEAQIRLYPQEEGECSPQELLKKLVEKNLLQGKALYVNAFCPQQERTRNFDITFKRIKWDTVEAVAVLINDTTYQANLVALKMANVNKDQIIATVSHELRTPLHGIIGLLDLAEKRVKDPEVLNHLSLCKDNANLLSSLVNSLLDLQQLASGKLKLNEVKINVAKTLNDIVQLFKFQTDQKNICLELEISQEVPNTVITDENRFKQILINLIGNAIKFTFKGGVKVKVQQDPENEDCLIISVIDTGIGIKEEDIGQLFKMYGKLANGSIVNKNGVGLGLTISSTLAALLNGQDDEKGVEVESQYGVGSKFYFRILKDLKSSTCRRIDRDSQSNQSNEEGNNLKVSTGEKEDLVAFEYSNEEEENPFPLSSRVQNYSWKGHQARSFHNTGERPLEAETKSEVFSQENRENVPLTDQIQKSQSGGSSINECVLVVDDNPFNILVAKSLLKDIGYEVKSASGGQEAIDIVQSCKKEGVPIKVIFMDCQMPIMDGYETTRILDEMMSRGEVPRVAILAWTANTEDQDIKRCYESGMTGYITKPTTKEKVLKAIPR